MPIFNELTYKQAADWASIKNDSHRVFRVIWNLDDEGVLIHSANAKKFLGDKKINENVLNEAVPTFYRQIRQHSSARFCTCIAELAGNMEISDIVFEMDFPMQTIIRDGNGMTQRFIFTQSSNLVKIDSPIGIIKCALDEFTIKNNYSFYNQIPVDCRFWLWRKVGKNIPPELTESILETRNINLLKDNTFPFKRKQLDVCALLSSDYKKTNEEIAKDCEENLDRINALNKKILETGKEHICPFIASAKEIACYLKFLGVVL